MSVILALALQSDVDSIDAILGPLLMLAIVGAVAFYGFRRWRLRAGASKWIATEATVQSGYGANLVSAGTAALVGGVAGRIARSNSWRAALHYSYYVAGESQSGYFLLGGLHGSPEAAEAATREWVGRKIVVRYNPKKPYESAFLPADGAPGDSRSLGDQAPPSDVITLSLK